MLALLRGAADAALISSFGALLLPIWIGRRSADGIAWASLGAAAVLTACWAALQGQAIGSWAELPAVFGGTLFGHLVLARLALLGLAALALRVRWRGAALVLAGLALASVAGQGHAMAMYEGPSWLLASEVLHLLAAGAWLGGLVPLAAAVAAMPPGDAWLASTRFSLLGTICVLTLAGTALFQSWVLIGSVPGLIGTAYGLVALAKLLLFVCLLGFAAANRFRLTPALAGPHAGSSKAALARSIAAETGVGLLAVLAAGLLTSLMPAMHDQPLWPFPWRLSLEAVSEDADLRREVLLALGALAATWGLYAVASARRWRVRYALAALAGLVLVRMPQHLSVLLAEAHPTQYWTSPTGFASASIVEGGALFPANCASCHGARGEGDGPAGRALPVPPADLTAAHLWAHPDGELYWWLSHGIAAPDGSPAMPGFGAMLDADQLWALIDWIRANNAGLAFAKSGEWSVPVQAPGLDVACADPEIVGLADLRGRVVRLVFGRAEPVQGAITVAVGGDRPGAGLCVAADEPVRRAYAVVSGRAAEALRGAEFLIDGQGWLRAMYQPGTVKPDALSREIAMIAAHPLSAAPPGHAGMRM